MSDDLAGRASRLMRERAEAATGGPWENNDLAGPTVMAAYGSPADGASIAGTNGWDDAEHIASWHPAVAMAASQLLAAVDRELSRGDYTVESDVIPTWLHCELDNLARVYLGESR